MIDQEIQARMNAFRGNPQALMQRYSQSQQLLDLLALQKLKSEKEAAMRQMQMQAGQGQMPTVAQQREQELMGMAKQEVTERVGQVAQQQAKQQQENLQRAAQTGIAQAPAPNMMPPQAMASGGIVAFSEGGTPAGRFLGDVAGTIRETATGLAERQQAATSDAEEKKRLRQAIDKALGMAPGLSGAFVQQSSDAWKKATALSNAAAARLATVDDLRKILAEATQLRAAPAAPAAPAGGVPPVTAGDERFEGRSVPVPKTTQPVGAFQGDQQQIAAQIAAIQDPNERAAAMAAFQRQQAAGPIPPAPQDQGIAQASMLQAQGIAQAAGAPAGAQPTGLQQIYEKATGSALGTDLGAVSADAEAAYAKRFDPLFQQQLALKQQGLAEAQRLAERERAMRDPLMAWMAGARGRTIGEVLGNAGRAGMEYQQQGLTRDQALAKQLQDLQEAQLGAQVTQEKEKYGVGEARRKEAAGEREKAMTSAGTYLTGMASADARRDIAEVQRQNAALRAQLGIDEKTANMIRQRMAAEEKIIDAKYAKDPRSMQAKFNPAIAAELKRERDAEYQNRKREIYAEFSKEPPEESGVTSAAPSTGTKTIPFSQLKSAGK